MWRNNGRPKIIQAAAQASHGKSRGCSQAASAVGDGVSRLAEDTVGASGGWRLVEWERSPQHWCRQPTVHSSIHLFLPKMERDPGQHGWPALHGDEIVIGPNEPAEMETHCHPRNPYGIRTCKGTGATQGKAPLGECFSSPIFVDEPPAPALDSFTGSANSRASACLEGPVPIVLGLVPSPVGHHATSAFQYDQWAPSTQRVRGLRVLRTGQALKNRRW